MAVLYSPPGPSIKLSLHSQNLLRGVILHPMVLRSPVFPFSLSPPRAIRGGAAEAPRIIIHRAALAHCMASSCCFSPCLSLLGISGIWLKRWSDGVRALHVTSLNVDQTHPCITALSLLALLAPCGMAHVDTFEEDLGCEPECFHKQLHQACRDRTGQYQQMVRNPSVFSQTQRRACPAWRRQEIFVPLCES